MQCLLLSTTCACGGAAVELQSACAAVCHCCMQLMNMMSSEQWADATIAAYPYIVPAPKCKFDVQLLSALLSFFIYFHSIYLFVYLSICLSIQIVTCRHVQQGWPSACIVTVQCCQLAGTWLIG